MSAFIALIIIIIILFLLLRANSRDRAGGRALPVVCKENNLSQRIASSIVAVVQSIENHREAIFATTYSKLPLESSSYSFSECWSGVPNQNPSSWYQACALPVELPATKESTELAVSGGDKRGGVTRSPCGSHDLQHNSFVLAGCGFIWYLLAT